MPVGVAICSWNEKEGLITHSYFPSTLEIPTVLVSELLTNESSTNTDLRIIQSGLSKLKGIAIPIDPEFSLYIILFLNSDESPETYRKSFLKSLNKIPKDLLSFHAISKKSNRVKIKEVIENIFWELTSLEHDAVLAQKLYDEIFSNTLQFVQILSGITVEGSEVVYGIHITNHSNINIEQITFQLNLPKGIIRADPKFNPSDLDLQKLAPSESHVYMFNLRYRGTPLGTITGTVSLKMSDGIYLFEIPPARLNVFNLVEYPQHQSEINYDNLVYNYLITNNTDVSKIIEGLILQLDGEIFDEFHVKHNNLFLDMWLIHGSCAYGFNIEVGIFSITDESRALFMVQVAGGPYEFNKSLSYDIVNAIHAAASLDMNDIIASPERPVYILSIILLLYVYIQIINGVSSEDLIIKLKDVHKKIRSLKMIALDDPNYEVFISSPSETEKQNIELITRDIWKNSLEQESEISFLEYLSKLCSILGIRGKALESLLSIFK